MARLELEGVSKAYGGIAAVSDVDLTVEDNEFFCIFGPPSCGKTTLLKLWLGLRQPDRGRVLIDGRDMAGILPGERDLAMVFQNLALFPHMSAKENIAFPLRERGAPAAEIERRVADAANRLHIAPLLHKNPGQLSGGERQRVAIGRTLVRVPRAFLMDEPIAALDARLREEMRVELKRLQRELRHTLIYVTHDQEEAMSIADRMAIMREGRIVQTGTPDEIYNAPVDRYVATLVGSPPMNVVGGRLSNGSFRDAEGRISLALAADCPDGPVDLGIRPEDLHLVAGEAAPQDIRGEVQVIEPLGAFTIVDVMVGATLLRIDAPGQPDLRLDQPVALKLRPDACYLFNPADGRTIWPHRCQTRR
ncbi:MAG TPA: ABC transporter ATP-binding protein [Verrucomicrobiae bacterium]|nr:ABC transporter ATP-binding protein [Verrucomicrobiae bacterium]